MQPHLLARTLCGTLLFGLLTGCTSSESGPKRPEPCGPGPNLIGNPAFALSDEQGMLPWKAAQHAGQASFMTSYGDGVFTVERTGPEHWFSLTQFVEVNELLGRRLEYRIDLKMDTNGEGDIANHDPGAGLVYRIWGQPFANLPAVTRQLVQDTFEHEPRLGNHDWTLVSKLIDVPENATRMQLGITLRANGELSVRNPELHDCGPIPPEEGGAE